MGYYMPQHLVNLFSLEFYGRKKLWEVMWGRQHITPQTFSLTYHIKYFHKHT